MSDRTDTPKPENSDQPRQPQRRRWFRYTIAGALAALIGGTALHAVAERGHGGWWGGHGWCAKHDGECSGRAHKFMEKRVDYLLYKLDATQDQRAEVKTILDTAFSDLQGLREGGRGGREALIAELAKPSVDRDALEALRTQHLDTADQASQRILQAIADAADVLTPEQRARLPEIAGKSRRHRDH